MQRLVQLHTILSARKHLNRAGDRVTAEQQVRHARQFGGLHHTHILARDKHNHAGTGGHVQARLNHTVIAQGDTNTRLSTQQGTLTD